MRFFYNIALHLLGILAAPKILYTIFWKGKYRKSFLQRFGKGFPKITDRKRGVIWVHAVSLGETKAIAPLVEALKKEHYAILLTTATETGFTEGIRLSPDYHAYLPLDFSYIIQPIVKKVKPDCILLTETDFWPNFLQCAKKNGALIALVNGKISERSFKRLLRFPFFAPFLFSSIDRLCLQGEIYANRFSQLGIDKNRMTISGNIKLNGFTKENGEEIREKLEIGPTDFVLTCGSTHDPEERIFLQHTVSLLEKWPQLKVILVPRHPERFSEVSTLLHKYKIPFGLYSQGETLPKKRVFLMDKMGQLRKCYSLSALAFVGGSLTEKVGGHNILEPCFYGVPTLYGPHMYGQPDLLHLIKKYDAGEEVTEQSLHATIEKYMCDRDLLERKGRMGRRLCEENGGAFEKTRQEIVFLLEKGCVC